MLEPGDPDETDDVVQPPIEDDSGYRIRRRDLRFLGIPSEAVQSWQAGHQPLGMSASQYREFCGDLMTALTRDSINLCDLRLQGSSVRFFSGLHKTFPHNEADWSEEYERNFRQHISREQLDEVASLYGKWFSDGPRPLRRPFDSMFVLTLNRDKSDYDLQISSDEIVQQADSVAPAATPTIFHPKYGFVIKDLVERVCPNLSFWAEDQADTLDRPVTIAVFASSGPPVQSGRLSSHFKDDDWRLLSQEVR